MKGSRLWRHDVGMGAGLAPVAVRRRRTSRCLGGAYSRDYVTPKSAIPDEDTVLLRLRQRLLGYARRTVAPDVAEDLVQDTVLLLTTKYAKVREPEERVRLGIAILVKKKSGYWRRTRRRGEPDAVDAADVLLEDGQPDPEEQAERRLMRERLLAAIGRLSGRCAELARLKLEDRTFPEIAEILQAKLNTVYTWDHRCLKKLRELMGVQEVQR
jgi:RNA polymerase sigma-70 factor, ECF subfamily